MKAEKQQKEIKSKTFQNKLQQQALQFADNRNVFDTQKSMVNELKFNNTIQRVGENVQKVEILDVTPQYKSAEETLSGVITIGHEFKLHIVGKNAKDCMLRWYENPTISYLPKGQHDIDGEYMKEGVWNNMYLIVEGESDIFIPWNEIKESEGDFDIIITDIPGISVAPGEEKKRTLKFRLIVEGKDGTERMVEASQFIEVETDGKYKSTFTVIQNDMGTSASGFVGEETSTLPRYR